jgi:hypothetical protein
MDVERNSYDTHAFIGELKNCPCICNYKSESDSTHIERNSAWAVICEKFSVNFTEMSNRQKME